MKEMPFQKVVGLFSKKIHSSGASQRESPQEHVTDQNKGPCLIEWAETLTTMSRDLLQFFSDKEEHFLSLGRIIHEGYRESHDLSASSKYLVNQINDQGQNESIEQLNQKVHEISGYWEMLNPDTLWSRLQKLQDVTCHLEGLLHSFERIVLRLKVLSVSTRVETARLGHEGEGFGILAQDVSVLNLQANDATQKIQEKTQSVQEDVHIACQKTKTLSDEQTSDADKLIQEVSSGLGQLKELQHSSAKVIENLSSHTEQISEEIGHIVSKIQFHDITRQQIQHVDEVLKEVQDVVTNQRDDQEMAESEQKILQWMSDVCDLQSSHIHASKEGFSQAIDHIRQSIYTIINQIQSIVSDMQGIGGEREGFSVLEKIQKDISLVVQALRQTAGKSNEVVDIMKVVGGVIHEMGEFIGNVEEVGFQIERIGLNASVQAAHIGENGRAMGVLAEAIHSLSLESNKQTQDITKILNEVISESKRFQTQAQEANELASKESDLIVSFEGLIRVLQQTQTNIQINLDEVGKLSNNLIEKLRTITEDRQLEHELMERFENAQQELGAIRQKVSEYLPEQGVNRSERLNSLLEKYTMESERQVHMQLFGHEEDAADDNISLFDDEAADNVELFDDLGGFEDNPEEKEEENEFGDNVELF